MASGFVIRKNQYYDSVFLMSVNARMLKVKGVKQTAVLMGSQANKQLLREIGIQGAEIDAAQPNDMIVARKGIEAGLNVFIFRGSVSAEEELELKLLAKQKGLLVMGPDCGTSLING